MKQNTLDNTMYECYVTICRQQLLAFIVHEDMIDNEVKEELEIRDFASVVIKLKGD